MDKTPSDQNKQLYGINRWGHPYFGINEKGHVSIKPYAEAPEGDLYELVESLVQRGIDAPILIRFDDIIRDRIHLLQKAFDTAIQQFEYSNNYQIIFPIKVNPQHHVVELIEKTGQPHHLGLEVGSKPELLAAMTVSSHLHSLLLCNGYKDAEYIELALLARKLGKRVMIVIETFYELPLILEKAESLKIETEIGFRMKPTHQGSGHWQQSGGTLAKFGLNIDEIVLCLEHLKRVNKTHWLKLLHFHLGSQITSIDAVKKALHEASRVYAELAHHCPSLCFFDAGGGLAVDYDGTKTISNSSMNYSVEEYARDIVFAIKSACQKAQVPSPTILTESGRALVAHHALLITEVIDVAPTVDPLVHFNSPPSQNELLIEMTDLYHKVTPETCLETLHDANELRETILDNFILGYLTLHERAYAEKVYHHLLAKIQLLAKQLPTIPQEIEKLKHVLLDNYFCNFSLFQSLLDSWAIDQIFPIMPIHRLNENPTRRCLLADMTCDSDGKIDRFVGSSGVEDYLPLHPFSHSPYYLGIFLVGAYQEILGDYHNLFGDTNAVHVELDNGQWIIKHVVEGDTVEEVLSYAEYDSQQILRQLRILIEQALQLGHLSHTESAKLQKRFKEFLESYTYLTSTSF